MATKKFRCKVCGYVHEGDKAPEKCPMCQAPQSEFEEIVEAGADAAAPAAKKGLNTNSNVYTILYAAVMVIIVAFLLVFVSQTLKERQTANVINDTKQQILAALNLRDLPDVAGTYAKVNARGEGRTTATIPTSSSIRPGSRSRRLCSRNISALSPSCRCLPN